MIYAADLEGKITKINATDNGNMFDQTVLFNAESNSSNGRYIYDSLEATINNDKLWLYFGTGDKHRLQTKNSNVRNRLYGIKDKDFPSHRPVLPAGDVSQCKTGKNNCPTDNDLGWYKDLDNSKKVTAKPTIDNDLVYFPIYEPLDAAKICDAGNALLYSSSSTCGMLLLEK